PGSLSARVTVGPHSGVWDGPGGHFPATRRSKRGLPRRALAGPEPEDDQLFDQKEAARRNLVVGERSGQEREQRPSDDGPCEGELVEPKSTSSGILPNSQRGHHDD